MIPFSMSPSRIPGRPGVFRTEPAAGSAALIAAPLAWVTLTVGMVSGAATKLPPIVGGVGVAGGGGRRLAGRAARAGRMRGRARAHGHGAHDWAPEVRDADGRRPRADDHGPHRSVHARVRGRRPEPCAAGSHGANAHDGDVVLDA